MGTSRFLISLLVITLSVLGGQSASAQNKTMGAATCASSNCHGSTSPRIATNVLQNEYVTWFKHGAHSQAYQTLRSADSKKIAAHLGIKDASSSEQCLRCHSTYVPNKASRGSRYRISDGVNCESCHGAAEKYLQPHTARDSSHANNVRLGMIDLVNLKTRAKVCLDCHLGNESNIVDHRLIGAGHPRLTYELDTYGILQPNHWEVDEDYVKRKAAYNSSRAWLVGQVIRSSEMLGAMASKERSVQGIFPELSLMYCYTCHHSLKNDQWKSRSYSGKPGQLRLNISSLHLVSVALPVLSKDLAKRFEDKLSALHTSYGSSDISSLVAELKTFVDGEVRKLVNGSSFRVSVSKELFNAVAKFAATKPYLQYEVAEQCAMAISAISASIDPSGKKYQKKIDAIYDALSDEEGYNPVAFQKASKLLTAG